jgi:DNA polymerase-1
MSLTLAVDTHSLMFRAFYAGHAGGGDAATGLAIMRRMLSGVISNLSPQYVIAARDPGGPTFRHELAQDYKGSRSATPDELKKMIPQAIQMLEECGIPVLCEQGFEADDILATLATKIKPGHQLVVLSSDRDLVGLVRPGVDLLMFIGGGQQKRVHHQNAHEIFKVPTHQVADYKALVGDSSDNIPGVHGIGPKTAVSLLEKYGDLESIISAHDELPAKVKNLLDDSGIEQARCCLKLAQLHEQVPVEFDAQSARWDGEKLVRLGQYQIG